MEKVGIRELRQNASAILRRVAGGETFEVTDRGRVVALLVSVTAPGLTGLERQGALRPEEGDLLDMEPLPIPRGVRPPSEVVAKGREE
jgi:prevent-host-death family protein